MRSCRNSSVDQLKSVTTVSGQGLIAEAGLMHDAVEQIPRTVAGKHAPRAVGTMGCGRQSNDEKPRPAGVTCCDEVGYRLSEVLLVAEARPFAPGNFTAMFEQSRASRTSPNLSIHTIQAVVGFWHASIQTNSCSGVYG